MLYGSGRGRILTALSPANVVSIKVLRLLTIKKLFTHNEVCFISKIFHDYSSKLVFKYL